MATGRRPHAPSPQSGAHPESRRDLRCPLLQRHGAHLVEQLLLPLQPQPLQALALLLVHPVQPLVDPVAAATHRAGTRRLAVRRRIRLFGGVVVAPWWRPGRAPRWLRRPAARRRRGWRPLPRLLPRRPRARERRLFGRPFSRRRLRLTVGGRRGLMAGRGRAPRAGSRCGAAWASLPWSRRRLASWRGQAAVVWAAAWKGSASRSSC